MLSQFFQVSVFLIIAFVYIRSPVLAQNRTETNSSNTSNIDANTTTNGPLENGADSLFPTAHTGLLLCISGAASLVNSLLIH